MNRIKVIVGVVVILSLVGCASPVQPLQPVELPAGEEVLVVPAPVKEKVPSQSDGEEKEVRLPTDVEHTLSVIPAFVAPESVPVDGGVSAGGTMTYRPAFFEISEVRPDGVVDTWTSDGRLNVGETYVEYRKGEPMFFLLYNQTDTPSEFSISVEDAPSDVNYLRSGSRPNVPLYRAPAGFLEWVSVPAVVVVQPGHAYKVPFGFVVPELDEGYPGNWEFRIRLADPKNQAGNVVVEYTLRVVIYMR